MLILVAVTVSYGIKSGLLTKAKDGGAQEQKEQERETLAAAVATVYDAVKGTISAADLQEELNKTGDAWEVTGEGTYTVKSPKQNIFTVDSGKESEPQAEIGKTLNSNAVELITTELLNYLNVQSWSPHVDYKYITYTSGNDSITISIGAGDTMGYMHYIKVVYKKSDEIIKQYFCKNWNSSNCYFDTDGNVIGYACMGYQHMASNKWTTPTASKCSCADGSYSSIICEPVTELPTFEGNWTLDTENSDSGLIPYLSNVLVDI